MKLVTTLGATGSIRVSSAPSGRIHARPYRGRQQLEVAHQICVEFGCKRVSFSNDEAPSLFRTCWRHGEIEILSGDDAAVEIASEPVDVVLAAMSGAEGLPTIIAAIRVGNRIALANKEAIVCCGPDLLALAARHGMEIIPVDSEHSAIFQSLLAGERHKVSSLLLTASGRAFRTATLEQMRSATREAAPCRPN